MQEAKLESLLFVAGDDGIELDELKDLLDSVNVDNVIANLEKSYENNNRGICIKKFDTTIKLVTKKEYDDLIKNYFDLDDSSLGNSALEVLAIIAYNEPITRIKIDEIRGVNSSHILRKLISKNLVESAGKSSEPGRPSLYKTTKRFLDYFGIQSLEELPMIKIDKNDNEINLYESRYKEN